MSDNKYQSSVSGSAVMKNSKCT